MFDSTTGRMTALRHSPKILLAALFFIVPILVPVTGQAANDIPTKTFDVQGSPIQTVGCTARREDSDGGYLSDYYIAGNASFVNRYRFPATEVTIEIHFSGAYGDHDGYLIKRGTFSSGVRIDPRRNAAIAMLNPSQLNIDLDGWKEIDIWDTLGATCSVIAAKFADGTQWNYATRPVGISFPALPAKKCFWDSSTKQYICK